MPPFKISRQNNKALASIVTFKKLMYIFKLEASTLQYYYGGFLLYIDMNHQWVYMCPYTLNSFPSLTPHPWIVPKQRL